jgi:hypothetical protein
MESANLVVHLKNTNFGEELCTKLDAKEKIKNGFIRLVVRSIEQLF